MTCALPMIEHPILFSGPMVRAILDGRKTMTRRVVKSLHPIVALSNNEEFRASSPYPLAEDRGGMYHYVRTDNGSIIGLRCPYGKVGARLWVKEGWTEDHPLAVQEGRYSQEGRGGIPGPPGVAYRVIYRADGEPLQIWRNADQKHPYFTLDGPADKIAAKYPTLSSNFKRGGKSIYWCNSRFMPRYASRITLELTGVRVERLQAISAKDIIAEGAVARAHDDQFGHNPVSAFDGCVYLDLKSLWAAGWNKINGKRAPWASNPFVWVLEFKRLNAATKE